MQLHGQFACARILLVGPIARRFRDRDDHLHFRQLEDSYAGVWSNPQDETLRPSGIWTIECVAVVEQARGRGVGTMLMRHIIDEARAGGLESIGISVTMGNQAAERLYQSVGFQLYVSYFSEYYDGMFPGTAKFRIRV